MATAITYITIVSGTESPAAVEDLFIEPATRRSEGLQKLITYLESVNGAVRDAKLTVRMESGTNTTKASATITCTQANAAGDSVTIGGVTLTEGAAEDFEDGASDSDTATNLAAAINAHADLEGLVSATVASNVVTVTCTVPGRVGNLIELATDDATAFSLSGSNLSGATATQQSAPRDWDFGIGS